jgi:hypothetical protein
MLDITHELKSLLLKIEGHEAVGQLDSRDHAIQSAVHIASLIGYKAGFRTIGTPNGEVVNSESFPIPEWAGNIVAYIELPTGEVSYFMQKDTSAWTGYTRKEKLGRIKDFIDNYPLPTGSWEVTNA